MTATAKKLDKIFLRGMKFFGRHGVLKAEEELGQPFLVDVELRTCLKNAGRSDDVNHTVDYSRVFDIVKYVIEANHDTVGHAVGGGQKTGSRCNLVETLATRIATQVLIDADIVEEITVSVSKPHIAFAATLKDVGVEIRRTRDDLNLPNRVAPSCTLKD